MTPAPRSAGTRVPRWPTAAFAAVAVLATLGGFVGLASSNFWTDELFTLHVIGHDGGLAEVLHRALTDTHPPLYYFLLYGWSRLGGLGEAWLRLPSALFAAASLAITALALRRRFTPTAIAFAVAAGAVSMFWFENAQNARSYSLAMLCSAALLGAALALRDRAHGGQRCGLALAWLAVLALLSSLVHAYLLLIAGMVLAWLLLALPRWRLRAAIVAIGLVVLAVNLAWTSMLLHSTTQDLHDMWFGIGPGFFAGQTRIALRDLMANGSRVAVLLLLFAAGWLALRRGASHLGQRAGTPGNRAALLALLVYAGLIACGIGISYAIAPSYSARNLLTASPFAWALLAWLYDAAGPRAITGGGRWAAIGLVVLMAGNLPLQRGRLLERNEAWRNSAQFVARMPGCAGQPVAVMQPYKFGPATPPYRALAAHDFYGHYAVADTPISAWLPSELDGRQPVPALTAQLADRAAAAGSGRCTLLLWGVHDLTTDSALELAEQLARAPGFAPRRVAVQTFLRARRTGIGWRPVEDGFVFYALPPAAADAPLTDPGALVALPKGVLGDRYVVTPLFAHTGTQGPAYGLDGYSVQHFHPGGQVAENFDLVPRTTCTRPMRASDDVRPDPTEPGCFARPL